MVRFLSVVLTCLILAASGESEAKDAGSLETGETQLPSGAVIKTGEAQSSAEAFKQQLQEHFVRQLAAGPEQFRAEALKQASAEEFALKLEVVASPANRSLLSICDEYVATVQRYHMQPVPAHLKKFIITIDAPNQSQSQKCEYDIQQGLLLVPHDRAPSQEAKFAVQSMSAGSVGFIFAPLAKERRADVRHTVAYVFIWVPFELTDAPRLQRFLTTAAGQLYSDPNYKDVTINFLAVAGASPVNYRLPAYPVMAFRSPKNGILLVEEIKLQVRALQPKGADERKIDWFVSIQALNLKLAEAAEAGKLAQAFAGDEKDSIYEDATEIFDSAGHYAADVFQVSQAVIKYRAGVANTRYGLNIPIKFEFDGSDWRITNRPK